MNYPAENAGKIIHSMESRVFPAFFFQTAFLSDTRPRKYLQKFFKRNYSMRYDKDQ
jgi:hypothetical protein